MGFKHSDELIECIPNFSEGRDKKVIDAIVDAIECVEDVQVLHVDMGFDANRTVITFAGKPNGIEEAAFQAVKTASELIDMRHQKGEHPRMGSTDVFPFVPLRNISMEKVVALSKKVGQRIGEELKIPIYLYEHSATSETRKNLAYLRKGEYESIEHKLTYDNFKPDFGPSTFNAKNGMTALGARDFLIAYNINLTTKDVGIAKQIAGKIRTSGRKENGKKVAGQFKGLKAIGWFMDEYNCAQVSTNIVDIKSAKIHEVFEATKQHAQSFGCDVNGSELIGLIPEQVLVEAGEFYSSTTFHKDTCKNLIYLPIKHLGLNTLSDFKTEERIIEKLLNLK